MEEMNVRVYTGLKIREYREGMHLTQGQLAKKVGAAYNTVCSWEIGIREPSVKQLYKMAVLFGIGVGELFPPTVMEEDMVKMEKELIRDFRALNGGGQTVAAAAVKGLAHMEEYRKQSES